jgi:hypothetical protein
VELPAVWRAKRTIPQNNELILDPSTAVRHVERQIDQNNTTGKKGYILHLGSVFYVNVIGFFL